LIRVELAGKKNIVNDDVRMKIVGKIGDTAIEVQIKSVAEPQYRIGC
jgi:hypothetical protein